MKLVFLGIICLFFCLETSAQRVKIGFVYEDYILQNVPQTKKLQGEVEVQKQVYETQLKAKAEKYQERYLAYQTAMKDISTITTESMNALVKEVQDLKKDAEESQAKAEQSLQKIAEEQLTVIQDLVEKNEKIVAKEKGYQFVFRRNIDVNGQESRPILLYATGEDKDDLSDAVILKMGGTPPVKK